MYDIHKIDVSAIPRKSKSRGERKRYPFENMREGDAFCLPATDEKWFQHCRCAVSDWNKRHAGAKFKTHLQSDDSLLVYYDEPSRDYAPIPIGKRSALTVGNPANERVEIDAPEEQETEQVQSSNPTKLEYFAYLDKMNVGDAFKLDRATYGLRFREFMFWTEEASKGFGKTFSATVEGEHLTVARTEDPQTVITLT